MSVCPATGTDVKWQTISFKTHLDQAEIDLRTKVAKHISVETLLIKVPKINPLKQKSRFESLSFQISNFQNVDYVELGS
jgi:hypothetical protein